MMELYAFHFSAMASGNEIQLYGEDAVEVERVARLAIDEVRRIERVYSRYRDDSVATLINASAGKRPVAVDAETAALLDFADACYRQSGGLFDITSGVLRRAWDFRSPDPRLPDPEEVRILLSLVGWDLVEWKAPRVRLPKAGMQLDFGGIGKEYAADRAAAVCVDAGMRHGFVNLGGDVRVIGPQGDGSPWRIGIVHPRVAGGVIAHITLSEGALATSGDYERYFELNGRRYCHILNPRTGYPVEGLQSASVVAPLCIVAGGLSTIAMLKGEDGKTFLREQGLPYLSIDWNGTIEGSLAEQMMQKGTTSHDAVTSR